MEQSILAITFGTCNTNPSSYSERKACNILDRVVCMCHKSISVFMQLSRIIGCVCPHWQTSIQSLKDLFFQPSLSGFCFVSTGEVFMEKLRLKSSMGSANFGQNDSLSREDNAGKSLLDAIINCQSGMLCCCQQ